MRTRITALRDKYSLDALDQNYSKQKHVKCAYVVFRSMEGAARAKAIYTKGVFSRFWLYITCRYNHYKS